MTGAWRPGNAACGWVQVDTDMDPNETAKSEITRTVIPVIHAIPRLSLRNFFALVWHAQRLAAVPHARSKSPDPLSCFSSNSSSTSSVIGTSSIFPTLSSGGAPSESCAELRLCMSIWHDGSLEI
jgi:hypothetical protein